MTSRPMEVRTPPAAAAGNCRTLKLTAPMAAAAPRIAYGCGWVGNGCAVLSCARRSPCTGLFAEDTWRKESA